MFARRHLVGRLARVGQLLPSQPSFTPVGPLFLGFGSRRQLHTSRALRNSEDEDRELTPQEVGCLWCGGCWWAGPPDHHHHRLQHRIPLWFGQRPMVYCFVASLPSRSRSLCLSDLPLAAPTQIKARFLRQKKEREEAEAKLRAEEEARRAEEEAREIMSNHPLARLRRRVRGAYNHLIISCYKLNNQRWVLPRFPASFAPNSPSISRFRLAPPPCLTTVCR